MSAGEPGWVRPVFWRVLTFGFNELCIDIPANQDGSVTNGLVKYISPAAFLFLTVLLCFLARFSFFARLLQRLQKRKTCTHVLWLAILYSSSLLAVGFFIPLECMPLSGTSQWRHRKTGNICFRGSHVYVSILSSIGIIIFTILPPLLISTSRVQAIPRLKGLLDEATHIYKDECRWWLSVNLGRRTVMLLILTSPLTESRELGMLVFVFTILVLHTTHR